jgi:hypothetical protein
MEHANGLANRLNGNFVVSGPHAKIMSLRNIFLDYFILGHGLAWVGQARI